MAGTHKIGLIGRIDPEDTNLRIAPSYPSDADLSRAAEVLCLCVKLAAAEKLARGNI